MENISVSLNKDGTTQFEYKHRFKLESHQEKLVNCETPDGSIDHIKSLTLEQIKTLALVLLDGDLEDIQTAEIT